MIVSNPCATNPLWLTIMLEELRVFGDFRTLNDKISRVADSVESLLNDILNRIVSEDNSGLVKKVFITNWYCLGGLVVACLHQVWDVDPVKSYQRL